MKCREAKKLLGLYIDGSLDEGRRGALEAHIAECESCAHDLELLSAYREKLLSLRDVKAPSGFLFKVRRRIQDTGKEVPKRRPSIFSPRLKVPLELAGALAVVLIAVVIFRNVMPQKERPLAPASEKTEESIEPVVREEPVAPEPEEKVSQTEPLPAEIEKGAPAEEKTEAARMPAGKDKVDVMEQEFEEAEEEKQMIAEDTEIPEEFSVSSLAEDRLAASAPSYSPPHVDLAVLIFDTTIQREREGTVSMKRMKVAEEAVESERDEYDAIPETRDPSLTISNIVEDLGGIVITLDYDGKEDIPSLITVQIPSSQYSLFLEKVRVLGELELPAPDLPPDVQEQVVLRIELLE